MTKIVIQEGHVARKTGVVGTHREQEFAKTLAPRLAGALADRGHQVFIIGADDKVPSCEVFVALHLDGNNNHSLRGASVGYPSNDPNSPSGRLANAWKRHHQRQGYSGGFHKDNYTDNLRYYYGFKSSNARYEFLAEHGTSTNPEDETWLFSHIDACVRAHVDAIGEVVGHPISPSGDDDEMKTRLVRAPDGAVFAFDGSVLRPANNEQYQNIVRWYSGQSEPWDQWSQEQIDACPKEAGAPE